MTTNPDTDDPVKPKLDEFNCKISRAVPVYVLGVGEPGSTIYRQQVRALNLAYYIADNNGAGQAMPEGGGVRPGIHHDNYGKTILVVGGGISGVTCAAALLHVGFKVVLAEKGPKLFHLQDGCSIRWLHPQLYEWPSAGSVETDAHLPLMNWRAGVASSVLGRLYDGWKDIARRHHQQLTLMLSCEVENESGEEDTLRFQLDGVEQRRDGSSQTLSERISPAMVVLATGFGVEAAHGVTPSYWRNDDLDQSVPIGGGEVDVAVFGAGDSAFIDCFRACLSSYRQNSAPDHLFEECPGLLRALECVKEKLDKARAGGGVFDVPARFKELVENPDLERELKIFEMRLIRRSRTDTTVTLVCSIPFEDCLKEGRASFFNLFLAFMLVRRGLVKFRLGEVELNGLPVRNQRHAKPLDEWQRQFGRVVVRYGPDIRAPLDGVLSVTQVDSVLALAKERPHQSWNSPRWPTGWWDRSQVELHDGIRLATRGEAGVLRPRREYLEPSLKSLADALVSGMIASSRFPNRAGGVNDVRFALHRSVWIDNEEWLQQCSDTMGVDSEGRLEVFKGAGRVFPRNAGVIGYAAHLCEPILASFSGGEFPEGEVALEALCARPIRNEARSMAAIPLLDPRRRALGVLFCDSTMSADGLRKFIDPLTMACQSFLDQMDQVVTSVPSYQRRARVVMGVQKEDVEEMRRVVRSSNVLKLLRKYRSAKSKDVSRILAFTEFDLDAI